VFSAISVTPAPMGAGRQAFRRWFIPRYSRRTFDFLPGNFMEPPGAFVSIAGAAFGDE